MSEINSIKDISEDQYASKYYFCDLKQEDEERDCSCECEGDDFYAYPNCPECDVAKKRHKDNDEWDEKYGGYHTVTCNLCGETKQERKNVLGTSCPSCTGVMTPEEEATPGPFTFTQQDRINRGRCPYCSSKLEEDKCRECGITIGEEKKHEG